MTTILIRAKSDDPDAIRRLRDNAWIIETELASDLALMGVRVGKVEVEVLPDAQDVEAYAATMESE